MNVIRSRRETMSFAAASLVVLTAIAAPQAQRRNRGDNSIHGAPVATNTIARAPERYYGKLVTVSAAVEDVLSNSVFVVDQRKAVAATQVQPVGSPLLVIAPNLVRGVERNRYFLVRGELIKLTPDRASGLAPDVLAKYDGQPVLLASSIIDSTYAELVKPPSGAAAASP